MNDKFYVLLFLGLLLGPGNIAFAYEVGRSIVYQDDTDDSGGDGCGACCCCLFYLSPIIGTLGIIGFLYSLPLIAIIIIGLIILGWVITISIVISKDAKKKGYSYPILWGLLIAITGPIGLFIYLLITRKDKGKEEK